MYTPQLLDHFEHPRNSGELPGATVIVQVENPACGDILELALAIDAGTIADARFRARGCVASVACASRLTELLIGSSITSAQHLQRAVIVESLGGLPEVSSHAGYLAMDALSAALKKLGVA